MKRTFISNLILLMSVNLLIKPFWILGIDRGVQNHVGYEQYGIYANLLACSMLLLTLLDLGINTYISSNVAKDPERLKSEFAPLTSFKIVSSFFYLTATVLLGYFNGYDSQRLHLLLFLGVNQALSLFYTYFRSITGGLQFFRADALLSVVDRVLMIILCGLILWGGFLDMNIGLFIYAQTISYSMAILITVLFLNKHLPSFRLAFDKALLVPILRQMFPYALLSLIMTFYTRLDMILIQRLLPDGDYQTGVYSSAYRLLEAFNMMAATVSMLLLPIFSKMIASRDDLNPLVQFTTGIMILPAMLLSYSCYLYRFELISALNVHSNHFSGEVFGVVIFCFIPLTTMYIYGTLLTAQAEMKTLNVLAFVALVLNLGLNLILIPMHKALGAAIATLVTQSFIGLTNFYFGKHSLRIQFERNFSRNFFVILSVILVSGWGVHLLIQSWFWGILLIGFIGLSLLLAFKIIHIQQAIQLVKVRFESKSGKS